MKRFAPVLLAAAIALPAAVSFADDMMKKDDMKAGEMKSDAMHKDDRKGDTMKSGAMREDDMKGGTMKSDAMHKDNVKKDDTGGMGKDAMKK
jgi:pentapeptide MXKDX repeat protein